MSHCQARAVGAPNGRNLQDQLGFVSNMQSKIADRSAMGKGRPRGAAVADFRFTSPFEP